jgi:predicted nicotinamide N-methyase
MSKSNLWEKVSFGLQFQREKTPLWQRGIKAGQQAARSFDTNPELTERTRK